MDERALPFMPRAGFAYFSKAPGDAAWNAASAHWSTRDGHGEGEDAWVRLALRGRDPFFDGDEEAAEQFQNPGHGNFPAAAGRRPIAGASR